MLRLAVVLGLLAVANGGILDKALPGTTSDYVDFFTKNFKSIQDLVPSDQNGLLTNAMRLKDLLFAVDKNKNVLSAIASPEQKNTLGQAKGLFNEVARFLTNAKNEGSGRFNENKGIFETLLNKVFNTSNLLKLLPLLTGASSQLPVFTAIITPLAILICRL